MKILKKLLWFVFFIYLIIVFIPKTNLYYFAESYMQKYNLVLNQEKTSDYFGMLDINDAQVYYEKIHVGGIKNIFIMPLIFYNQVSVNEANFSSSLKQFLPKEIKKLTIRNTIFYPTKVWINAYGEFGELDGYIDIYKQKVRLELKPTKYFLTQYKAIIKQFKKNKDIYLYETTYK